MVKISKFVLPLLILIIVLTACGDKYEGDFSYKVNDFTFTNQDGETVKKSDLEGNFWVADFVFTNCTTVCPPMTANMVNLQKQLKDEGLDDVQLVSFSVDPENDTPEILKEYAESYGGSLDNWHLLTGYDFDTIKELSIKSFKASLEKYKDSDQVMHVVSFYIVTPEGNAIKRYQGNESSEMEQIVKDLKKMQ